MQKLQLPFKGVGLGLLYGPLHVRLGDGVPAADGGEAVAGDAFEVGATHAHHHPLHLDPGHPFRLEEALADGLRGPFQVDHHPAPQPLGGTVPSPMMSKTPSGASSPMTVVTLVVPTSKPAMIMGADSPPRIHENPPLRARGLGVL